MTQETETLVEALDRIGRTYLGKRYDTDPGFDGVLLFIWGVFSVVLEGAF